MQADHPVKEHNFMAESTKRQACIAVTVLLILLSAIVYFLYWVKPVVRFVPVDQALQSVEAEKRSKELEERLLKSMKTNSPTQPDSAQP
jgi:hypothetical protein